MGNTVSCYFLDPEGNCVEVYALVAERDEARINRKLDLDKSVTNRHPGKRLGPAALAQPRTLPLEVKRERREG
jgi:catechol-2,3-dioxygenase